MDCFQLEKFVTFLNHGSYGATPKSVTARRNEIARSLLDPSLTETDLYRKQWEFYQKSVESVAEHLNIRDKTKIILEHNGTGAWNRILQYHLSELNSKFSKKVVFRLDQTYGSMLSTCHFWLSNPEFIIMDEKPLYAITP